MSSNYGSDWEYKPDVGPGVDPIAGVDMSGWGNFLNGTLVDSSVHAGGGNDDIYSYLKKVQQYDPNASIKHTQGSDGQDLGMTIDYDMAKMPHGAAQALTGPTGGAELNDPMGKNPYKGGTDNGIVNPNLVKTDSTWGTHTGWANNNYNPESAFDKYGQMAVMATIAAMTGGALAPMMGVGGGAVGAGGVNLGADGFVAGSAGDLAAGGSGAYAGGGGAAAFSAAGGGTGGAGGFLGNLGSQLNPSNIATNIGNNLSSPSWWANQAIKQGIGVIQNGGHFDPLNAATGIGLNSMGSPAASMLARYGMAAAHKPPQQPRG